MSPIAEVAWGTGDIWSVAVDDPRDRRKVLSEETSWSARPETSPDGKLVLFASYHGRQWRQLWVTTPGGAAPLPLTFGDFDRWNARWSPDGRRIALISNQHGNTSLVVHDFVGGAETPIVAAKRRYKVPQARLTLDIRDERGRERSGAGRRARQRRQGGCAPTAPGCMPTTVSTARCSRAKRIISIARRAARSTRRPATRRSGSSAGFGYLPWRQTVKLVAGSRSNRHGEACSRNDLPASFGTFRSADLHVHMNYGGHYREHAGQPRARRRAPRISTSSTTSSSTRRSGSRTSPTSVPVPDPASGDGVLILHSQEYHTSYWGHLGLLGLSDHYLTPGFSAYQNSPLASPYPDNGASPTSLTRRARWSATSIRSTPIPDPAKDKSLTNELPADVANGKVDYMEIVGFSDHKATAEIWYRLLNLGLPAADRRGHRRDGQLCSLRGPVGMNRVFLDTGGDTSPAASRRTEGRPDVREQRTAARTGGRRQASRRHGLARCCPGKLDYRIALRSPVAVDHLELVQNGKVVKAFALTGDRRKLDAEGDLPVDTAGWLVLRAWNDGVRSASARHLSLCDDQPGLSRASGRAPARTPRMRPISSPGSTA